MFNYKPYIISLAEFMLKNGYTVKPLPKVILKKDNHISTLSTELLETKKSYQDWKEKAQTNIKELGQMIDDEFAIWHLSESEKDVALLLIKGLSMKEIAEIINLSLDEENSRNDIKSMVKKLCDRFPLY